MHVAPLQQVPTILICRSSLVRAGIRHILDGSRFTVSREAENSSRLSAFPDASPALYIVGESHSADTLFEIVAYLKVQGPPAQVVVLADSLDPTTMMQALQAGANGLCSARMERDALLKAFELVMLGETFIASAFALAVLTDLSPLREYRASMAPALAPGTVAEAHHLSSREVEILRHLMEGESNKVIASRLQIAEATVKVHLKTILRKLRANNRTQAAMWASAHLSPALDSMHITSKQHG